MKNKGTRFVFILLGLALVGTMVFYLMWNKPHTNVASSKPITVDAVALYTVYSTDSATAKTRYQEKVVAVTGKLHAQTANQQQQQVVTLETAVPGAYVNCTMEQQMKPLPPGTTVTLKGICSGIGAGDADLGILGDVYLIRCYLENQH